MAHIDQYPSFSLACLDCPRCKGGKKHLNKWSGMEAESVVDFLSVECSNCNYQASRVTTSDGEIAVGLWNSAIATGSRFSKVIMQINR